jgi:type II secretory pathway pseudopilin PulG
MKNTRHSQAGDFLIESLIGVLLLGLVGAGIATTASRVMLTSTEQQLQSRTLFDLQNGISSGQVDSLCEDGITTKTLGGENAIATINNCATKAAGAPGENTKEFPNITLKINGTSVSTPGLPQLAVNIGTEAAPIVVSLQADDGVSK